MLARLQDKGAVRIQTDVDPAILYLNGGNGGHVLAATTLAADETLTFVAASITTALPGVDV